MNIKIKLIFFISLITILICDAKKLDIKIILGSTRQGRTSEKLGRILKVMADKNDSITTEIIDLRDYNLPFFNDEMPPAYRETVEDPITKKWSDKINEADAFIIVSPEYNSGYSGVLKNAMDSLYKEWNNKPVAFVGYSGGESGATSAVAQLRQVAKAFQMIPVSCEINIGTSWKAFDTKGNLVKDIENDFNNMINEIVNLQLKK
ncbi:NAD(P)H-dependent oxidoreductase [Candidatus Dependentiae bacterium]|nr:NAD(P)H-dependent oxidoreductase [Candidatus Dependentiae bacterium]